MAGCAITASGRVFLAAYGVHVVRTWALSRGAWVEVVEA